MKTPHKHAELIKAWADGAEIEHFSVPAQMWMYTAKPAWYPENQYRIKPEPKPDQVVYPSTASYRGELGFGLTVSVKNQLKLTFDGETGELKSAEVL